MPDIRRIGLNVAPALLASGLFILSFPNFNLHWLAWIAVAPLAALLLAGAPAHPFMLGWLAGTAAYAGILYWIIDTFQAAQLSMGLAVLSLGALAAYLGLYWGAWAWWVARLARRGTAPLTIALASACAWAALELLRTHLFSGFPWTLLGDSQTRYLAAAQIASVTGVYGVSFVLALTGTAAAMLWRHRRAPARARPAMILASAVAALSLLYGHWRLQTAGRRPLQSSVRVAILQGNIDQYKKWDRAYVDDIRRRYESLAAAAARARPDVIVWPETSVPGYLLQDPPLRLWLSRVIRATGTNHLVGAPVLHGEHSYNSAFSMNDRAAIRGEYAKQHLVPFGEVVPWSPVLGRWIGVLNELGGFAAGVQPSVLPVGPWRVGVNICYEAIFPDIIRRSVRQGAQIVANLTNDGWYMRTAAPYQHLAPNVLRAIESGRWVVRADNTGVSAIIDPFGRRRAASPIFEPAILQGAVEPLTGTTPYVRLGDLFAWLCAGFCALIWLLDILRS